jgi:hypothetical protein
VAYLKYIFRLRPYIRRFERVIQGQTFSNGAYPYTRRFSANGNLTVNSTIVSSGAQVDFFAGGVVNLGDGFTAQNGATVKIWSWHSGLAKRAIYKEPEPLAEHEPSVQGLSVIKQEPQLIVHNGPEGFFVRYFIPQDAPVIIKLFDISGKLIKRFNVGIRTLGDHTEYFSVQNIATPRIFIVSLNAGKTTLSKKLVTK